MLMAICIADWGFSSDKISDRGHSKSQIVNQMLRIELGVNEA